MNKLSKNRLNRAAKRVRKSESPSESCPPFIDTSVTTIDLSDFRADLCADLTSLVPKDTGREG